MLTAIRQPCPGAWAQPDENLYDRLGGVFAIAAVVDQFSDAVVKNPMVGQQSKNPQLREWHTKSLDRLPGLKFMRTLWVCNAAGGGPFEFKATKPGKMPLDSRKPTGPWCAPSDRPGILVSRPSRD